jgi:hypothetical protein
VFNLPLYQRNNNKIDSARVFSGRYKDLDFRTRYARLFINHDFRIKDLYFIGMLFPLPYVTDYVFFCQTNIFINKLYSSAQRIKYNKYKDENTYYDFYAP